jgi:alkaline phosphatase
MNYRASKSKKLFIGLLAGMFLLAPVQSTYANDNKHEYDHESAKNVILMISDGQGFNTVKATEYYTGSKAVYERFKSKYAMQTNSAGKRGGYVGAAYDPAQMMSNFAYANGGATDSASAATAMYTGVKNFDNEVNYTTDNKALVTFFEMAAKAGKSIGAVSTVNWTHATPVTVFGHNIARGNYGEMAKEAIYGSNPNSNNASYDARNYYDNLKVVMGSGHPWYDNDAKLRSVANYGLIGNESLWNDLSDGINNWTLITTKEEFEDIASARKTPSKVFGIPQAYDTIQYSRSISTDGAFNSKSQPYGLNGGVPDLSTMALAALNVLDNNKRGFAIMIEGGAVDWANHADRAGRMIEEQIDFNNAVSAVAQYLDKNTNGNNWGNTLLIVTADHECGHLWGDGRVAGSTFFDVDGNSIFDHGVDYAHVKDNGVGNLPEVWYHSGSHTNALVPLFTKGAESGLFEKCVIGVEPNLRDLYNLDGAWSGEYIDNTCIFQVMKEAVLE